MSFDSDVGQHDDRSLTAKLVEVNWLLIILLCVAMAVGVAMLYSAADGNFEPWAKRQLLRFCFGLILLLFIALTDIRIWLKYAYLIYLGALALLVLVEIGGSSGMGARRWISLGAFQLQPSELMKLAIVLALARYFHFVTFEHLGRIRIVLPPLAIIAAPVVLVLRQPDLGTALLLIMTAGIIFVAAGIRWWKFAVAAAGILAIMPVAWQYLREYQKIRILTFLNPEDDPLGAGYHIMQSKIALGSGGMFGKGFMQGTQSHLSFLPERHTDFIFTMLAEEFGFVGCVGLVALYTAIIAYGFAIARRSQHQFGRLLAIGVSATFFLYVFINIAMVTGLIPVVGVPLPLVSYGGTSMLTILMGFGFAIGVYVHRARKLPGY